jgi:hemoglobin-like flavoprotein
MTNQQATLVRNSYEQLIPVAGHAAELFYRILFNRNPELRALFVSDPEVQRQKFLYTLDALIKVIDRPEALLPEATELGHRHLSYGVLNEHYPAVGQALLSALREELAGHFSADVENAWEALYDLVARAMKGEEIAPVPVR